MRGETALQMHATVHFLFQVPHIYFVIVRVKMSAVDGSGLVKYFKCCCKFFLRFRVICNNGDELEIQQEKEIY